MEPLSSKSFHETKKTEFGQVIKRSFDKKISNIQNVRGQIDQATKSGSVLQKINSLSDIEAKILETRKVASSIEQEIGNLNNQKKELQGKIKTINEELNSLQHPIWGRGRQKYQDHLGKEDPIQKLQNEISLHEKTILDINSQLAELKAITPDRNMIAQALTQVRESLTQINQITLTIGDNKVNVPLKNLIDSSPVFRKMYESGLKESGSNELSLVFHPVFEQEEIQAFIDFFKTNEVKLTGDNVLPLLQLADQYEVKPLLNHCLKFLEENASSEQSLELLRFGIKRNQPELVKIAMKKASEDQFSEVFRLVAKTRKPELVMSAASCASWKHFPILLDTGINTGQKELIWKAITLAMEERKALKRTDFTKENDYQMLSDQTKVIMDDLKSLAKAWINLDFYSNLGFVKTTHYNKDLSHFNNLSQLVPLTLEMNEISNDKIPSLAEKCPFIEHLIFDSIDDYQPPLLKDQLKGFEKLKSFGNLSYDQQYKSMEEIENFQKQMSPIAINALNLKGKYFKDEDIKRLAQDFKDLKFLFIDKSNISNIPFDNLVDVRCSSCSLIKNLDLSKTSHAAIGPCSSLIKINVENTDQVEIGGCPIESLDAPNASRLMIGECPKLMEVNSPKAKGLLIRYCPLKNLSLEKAEFIEIDHCSSLESLDAPNAREIILSKKGSHSNIKLNVPDSCEISYSDFSHRK